MKILYIGPLSIGSNSLLRMKSIQSLGFDVTSIDPYSFFFNGQHPFFTKIHRLTGYIFTEKKIYNWLNYKLNNLKDNPDLIWIDSGEFISRNIFNFLKKFNCPIILLNNDDVAGNRDGNRFLTLKKSLSLFDYCFVYRVVNIDEYKRLGAKNVKLIKFSYDEYVHEQFDNLDDISDYYKSDVSFIGTYMKGEKRDEFIYRKI